MSARWLVAALAIGASASCGESADEELYGSKAGSGGASAGASGALSGGAAGEDASAGSAGSAGEPASGGSAGSAGVAGHAGGGGEAGKGGQSGTGGSGGAQTPGTIQCGNGICTTNYNICCTCPGCPIPYPTQCFPKITGCTGTGKTMVCDDSADCDGGKVCCAHFELPKYTFTGASCEASCPDEGNAQLCTVDAECPDGRACKPLASVPGFRACQPK